MPSDARRNECALPFAVCAVKSIIDYKLGVAEDKKPADPAN